MYDGWLKLKNIIHYLLENLLDIFLSKKNNMIIVWKQRTGKGIHIFENAFLLILSYLHFEVTASTEWNQWIPLEMT